MPSLADELKRLRAAAKLTQKQLAEAVAVSQPFIADLESGKRGSASYETFVRLSDALGVDCTHWRKFLADEPAEKKPAKRKPK